jgi:hypothetical protein
LVIPRDIGKPFDEDANFERKKTACQRPRNRFSLEVFSRNYLEL